MTIERDHPEQMLRAAAAALDASPLPTAVLDRGGCVRGWNTSAEEVFGWRWSEVEGRPAPGIPESERERYRDVLERTLAGERITGVEAERLTKDGRVLMVRLASAPLWGADGEVIGAIRTMEDITDRVRIEGETRAREEQMQLALQLSRMVAWEWDVTRNLITTSDNFREMYGLPALAGAEEGFALVHPDDVERHRQTVDTAVAEKGSYRSEFRIIRPDTGATAWLEERGSSVCDETGRVRKLVGVVMDVTARKEAEGVLRAQAALLELTGDAVLVREWGTDRIGLWNRAAEVLYGFGAEEAVGQVSHRLLRTLHPVPLEESADILLRTGHWEGELIHTTRDGKEVIVSSRWALRWDGGRPMAVLETNTDITEQKRAEERLQASEERYRTIVQTANEGIWLVDAEGKTLYANRRMADMLAYTPEELAGRGVLDCVFPADRPAALDRIARNLAGEAEQFDFRFCRKDGKELLVLGCTSPLRDGQGGIAGALGMFTDVTARRDLERQRSEIIAAVAHDLRNPLTTVKGMAQLLQRRLATGRVPDAESLRPYLTRIEQSAGGMTTLLNELLDAACLETGQQLDLRPRLIDLVALAARSVEEQRDILGERGSIRLEAEAPEIVGSWDPDRLERVAANLLSNAIKYSPQGPDIAVRVGRHEGWAVLAVRDRGIGIPGEDLPHIWERFRRGGNVGRDTVGMGIGLSGVRQIVEQHGGMIEVESREGGGSTFTVRLPLRHESSEGGE